MHSVQALQRHEVGAGRSLSETQRRDDLEPGPKPRLGGEGIGERRAPLIIRRFA